MSYLVVIVKIRTIVLLFKEYNLNSKGQKQQYYLKIGKLNIKSVFKLMGIVFIKYTLFHFGQLYWWYA